MPALTLRRPRSFSTLSSTSSYQSSFSSSSSAKSSTVQTPCKLYYPSQDALTLLNMSPSQYSVQLKISKNSLVSHRRRLEIRANVLLFLKPQHQSQQSSTLQSKDVLFATTIPNLQHVLKLSNNTIQFSSFLTNYKVIFPSAHSLTQFLSLLQTPFSTYSNEPSRPSECKIKTLPLLGKGATSQVRLLSSSKAIKCINKLDIYDTTDSLVQFIHEQQTFIKLLGNEFNLQLLDAFQNKNFFYFVTEVAEYGDLYSILLQLKHQRISENVIETLSYELIQGLNNIHKKGLLYRDMKLANILIDTNGHVKIADFGLCKPMETKINKINGDVNIIGRTSSFVGTRRYMSPELINSNHRSYGSSVDVWALGITLYIMITGKYPHNVDLHHDDDHPSSNIDYTSLFLSITNDDITIPDTINNSDLRNLLQGMLNRDALERLSMNEVLQHPWVSKIKHKYENRPNHLVNEDVVSFLKEHHIKSCFDKTDEITNLNRLDSSLITTSDGDDDECQSTAEDCNNGHDHLLGFEFLQ